MAGELQDIFGSNYPTTPHGATRHDLLHDAVVALHVVHLADRHDLGAL